MAKPFFSIILATYNRASTIRKAIDSVLAQTYSNWELIVVDDGSHDTTKTTLKQYTDPRITCIFAKHRGVSITRNSAIKKAKGAYITFIDSDDWYLPEHLEKHKDIIQKTPKVDLFHGGVKVIGSTKIPDIDHPGKKITVDKCTLGGTFFIKRSVLQKVGGFPNKDYAEDHALYLLLKKQGYTIKRINIPTYVYNRTQPDEITKSVTTKK